MRWGWGSPLGTRGRNLSLLAESQAQHICSPRVWEQHKRALSGKWVMPPQEGRCAAEGRVVGLAGSLCQGPPPPAMASPHLACPAGHPQASQSPAGVGGLILGPEGAPPPPTPQPEDQSGGGEEGG